MNSRYDVAQLIRLDPPPVDADPVFLARLAGLATASRPSPTPAARVGGLRIAAATAGVLAVTAGAAVAAQHLSDRSDGPQPVHRGPTGPGVTQAPDHASDDEGDSRDHDGSAVRPGARPGGDHTGTPGDPAIAPGAPTAPTTGASPTDTGEDGDGAPTSAGGTGDGQGDQGDQGDDQQGSGQDDQGGTGSGDQSGDGSGDGSSDGGGSNDGDASDDPTSGAGATDGSGDGDLGVNVLQPRDGDGGQSDH